MNRDYYASFKMPHKTAPFFQIIILTLFSLINAHAVTSNKPDISAETRLSNLANTANTQIAKSGIHGIKKVVSMPNLTANVEKFIQINQPVIASSLIVANLELIKNNITDRSVLYLLSVLLNNNDIKSANTIFASIKVESDKSLISNASFLYAKYYFSLSKWQECLEHTKDIIPDLTDSDANYARLMTGVSLQQQKKHRQAIEWYSKIQKNSDIYLYARLNSAIAYIKQGWWSDAQIVINEVINTRAEYSENNEIINRLYLVLGYSLLQKEFYRESREAFRNIHADSLYSNRALLGISLASANQGDFLGSLNTLSLLKDKKYVDISVEESYLLLPYIYKSLGQVMTAMSAYNDAINYYQNRIDEISKTAQTKTNTDFNLLHLNDEYFIENNNNMYEYDISYNQSYDNILSQVKSIINVMDELNDKSSLKTRNDLVKLQDEITKNKLDTLVSILNTRKSHLESYLSQSRYGLANLYDTHSN